MTDPVLSRRRVVGIIVVSAVLAVLLAYEVVTPIRQAVSTRFVDRGDTYMVSLEFDQAKAEYREALRYDAQNGLASQRLSLAEVAPADIAQAKGFYQEKGVASVIQKLDKAQQSYTDPKQAVLGGLYFYTNKDYVYARYPLEQAVQLDPGYPDAWNYLALTYQQLAKLDPSYEAKATEAFRRRDTLTPKYLAQ